MFNWQNNKFSLECITNVWLAEQQDCTCITNIWLAKQRACTCITNIWLTKQQDFTCLTNVSKQKDCACIKNTALFGPVYKYPFLFETGDFFGHRKRYVFKNVLQTEDFWKRWLLVYVWTDKNRSFRIRWFHISFTTSITFPLFNVFYGRAKTVWISYVWARIFLKMQQKDLRFQKYPDTCGRGLYCGASTLICSKLTFQIYCNERIRWFGTPTRGKSGNGKESGLS